MPAHAHPMVSKSDVASLNERYAPWRIEKAWRSGSKYGPNVRGGFDTQARNTETSEVIYRCEGWTQASRGQALNAILDKRQSTEREGSTIKPDGTVVDQLGNFVGIDQPAASDLNR